MTSVSHTQCEANFGQEDTSLRDMVRTAWLTVLVLGTMPVWELITARLADLIRQKSTSLIISHMVFQIRGTISFTSLSHDLAGPGQTGGHYFEHASFAQDHLERTLWRGLPRCGGTTWCKGNVATST
jgi:hypothetical protein